MKKVFIFLFGLLCFFGSGASFVYAGTLEISPIVQTVKVGDVFTQTVYANSPDQAMNAISGSLSFPQDTLEVLSVSKASSILTLWVQEPAFSNGNGSLTWSGVVPNPGYTGSRGKVLSIQFRAKRTGTASIVFASSAMLANDGSGTNILSTTIPATISVGTAATPPAEPTPIVTGSIRITSPTHPRQDTWYATTKAVMQWSNLSGSTAARIGYDKYADGEPTVVYEPAIARRELDLKEGVWYFHVQNRTAAGWGVVSTYTLRIDTTAPEPVAIQLVSEYQGEAEVVVHFATTDELSGMSHYVLSVDGVELPEVPAEAGRGNYTLPPQNKGKHTLKVVAYDKAGNAVSDQISFTVTKEQVARGGIEIPWPWPDYIWIILIAIILGAFLYRIRHLFVGAARVRKRGGALGHTYAVIHREFEELKGAVADEIATLRKVKSKRALTTEEERIVNRLSKMLDKSARTIEREVEDLAE